MAAPTAARSRPVMMMIRSDSNLLCAMSYSCLATSICNLRNASRLSLTGGSSGSAFSSKICLASSVLPSRRATTAGSRATLYACIALERFSASCFSSGAKDATRYASHCFLISALSSTMTATLSFTWSGDGSAMLNVTRRRIRTKRLSIIEISSSATVRSLYTVSKPSFDFPIPYSPSPPIATPIARRKATWRINRAFIVIFIASSRC